LENNKINEAMSFFSQLVTDGGNVNTPEKLNFMRLCWNRLVDAEIEIANLKKLSECQGDTQNKITAERWMLDNILYIGNKIPEPVANDDRDKFVLLGYPQQMIDAVDCK
jgi:hypothetical protein